MFDELPETIPHKNKKKLEAILGAAAIQIALVAGIIVIQMAMPEKLGQLQLLQTLYMAPPPPPPAPAPSEAPQPVRSKPEREAATTATAPVVVRQPQPVEQQPKLVAPTTIPQDIARIVDSGGPPRAPGVPGGVPGGISGGVAGGTLGGLLGGTAAPNVAPPPPTAPVRVGGNVKQPKLLHIEQPKYPIVAKEAHVEGVVVVEATVTADGSVEKVKAISGPTLLLDAATDAVSRWKYEPTYLNGQAVPVILMARITFSLGGSEK